MALTFAVTFDYRCAFARNFHDHLVVALAGGAPWDVEFVPFSQSQSHVEPGDPPVWDQPEVDSGLLAMQVGVHVRDHHPEAFLAVHRDIFGVRHVQGRRLTDPDPLRAVLDRHGLDGADIVARAIDGEVIPAVRKGHEWAEGHGVWGVPTVIVGDDAAFIRLMNPSDGDAEASRTTIERCVALVSGWPELNELKHVRIDR